MNYFYICLIEKNEEPNKPLTKTTTKNGTEDEQ